MSLGLCDADESCQRFLERCLPECFNKLLNNGAVRRWGLEIQEGVFTMLDLLTNFIIVRLKRGPIPENILKNTYTLVCFFSGRSKFVYIKNNQY